MKKTYIFFITIISLLIIARLCMTPILLRYVVYRVNQIPEYKVNIEDLSIDLYKGSYTLKNVDLHRINKKIPVPFFSAETVEFAIQWGALLHGAIVGKIYTSKPHLNFVMDPNGNQEQLTIDQEWERAVKALFPLNFNLIKGEQGRLSLQSFTSKPPFKLFLKDINFSITNMQNVERSKEQLPSQLEVKAKSMDGAPLNMQGKFNPFTKKPVFYFTASLKAMDMKEANAFLQHYISTDIKQGKFSLYVEAAAKKGKIAGYAKPIVKDLKIINPKEPMGPVEALYKGALEIVAKVLTNSETKTIATKINLSGNVDDPDTSTLSIVGYLLRHSFIHALLPQVDHSIKMRDVEYSNNKNTRTNQV